MLSAESTRSTGPRSAAQRLLHGGVGSNERHVERRPPLPELPGQPPGVYVGIASLRADDHDAASGLREVEPRLHPEDGDGERGALGFQPIGLGAHLVHGAVRRLHRLGRHDERDFLHDGSRPRATLRRGQRRRRRPFSGPPLIHVGDRSGSRRARPPPRPCAR